MKKVLALVLSLMMLMSMGVKQGDTVTVTAEGEDEDYISGKYMWETYLKPGAPYHSYSSDYVGTKVTYAPDFSFDGVGILKTVE